MLCDAKLPKFIKEERDKKGRIKYSMNLDSTYCHTHIGLLKDLIELNNVKLIDYLINV